MDALSVSISIGTFIKNKKDIIKQSIIVGIFHLIMPQLGTIIGETINDKLLIKTNMLTSIIFLILAIQMKLIKEDNKEIKINNIITYLTIALSVSMDSFSVGIALGLNREPVLLAAIIFMICSTIFTYIGLILGKKLREKTNDKANKISIIIMIIVSIKYLIFN